MMSCPRPGLYDMPSSPRSLSVWTGLGDRCALASSRGHDVDTIHDGRRANCESCSYAQTSDAENDVVWASELYCSRKEYYMLYYE